MNTDAAAALSAPLVVELGDADATDPARVGGKAASLAAAGRERARTFDAALMTDRTLQVYQDVLGHA